MELHLQIIRLSDRDPVDWDTVGEEMGMPVQISESGSPPPAGTTAAAVVSGDALEVREWFDHHGHASDVPVLAVCPEGGHRVAAQVVKQGAEDFFSLPDDMETFINALGVIVRNESRRRSRDDADPSSSDAFASIVGESPAIRAVVRRAQRILEHRDATALIVGETGTGKEVLARAIHEGGPRRHAPFVAVNCSSIPATLFESELFGHERGAFTDANQEKPGLFEVAEGGTIFFDELGLLPADLQSKMLRVLEDRRVRRLGSTQDRELDVRILAATNEDLEKAVRAGDFREDFFYRIAVIQLSLPPLRDRGDDVLKIAEVLLGGLARHHGVPAPALGADVRRRLRSHAWPGNVRELRNALERSLLLSPGGRLSARELGLGAGSVPVPRDGDMPFPATLRAVTHWAAKKALEQCAGNRSEAARLLDISRARLRRLLADDDPPATERSRTDKETS